MPNKRFNKSIKGKTGKRIYEALRRKGMGKTKAARIANSRRRRRKSK